MVESILAPTISGLLQGALYGAIAVGLSLVFGVMRVINFTHGSLLMLGMFISFYATRFLNLDTYVGLAFAVPVMFVVGYGMQSLLITPLYRRERSFIVEPTSVLILTAGLWLILDNGTLILLGSRYREAPSALSDVILRGGSVNVPLTRLLAAVGAVAFTIALRQLLTRTNIGRFMRATAQNRDAAALAGINIYRVYAVTFGLGAALTAAAGALLLPFYFVFPTVGFSFDIRAFLIVVLGGLGSIWGTFVAGLLMGVVEALATQWTAATYAQLIFFVLFIAVLVAKPAGLLGRERV
jgi:branched-chain amino acid transport system permease protein